MDRLPTGLDYLQGGGSRVSRAWVVPMAQTDPGMAGVLTFFGDESLHFCESMMANVTNVNEFEAPKKKLMRFFFGHRFLQFFVYQFRCHGISPTRHGDFYTIAGVSCYQLAEVFAGFPFLQQANAPANPAQGGIRVLASPASLLGHLAMQSIGIPWAQWAQWDSVKSWYDRVWWVDGFKHVLMAWYQGFKTTQSRLACEKHCASMSIDGPTSLWISSWAMLQCCKALRMPRQSQMWWQRLAPVPRWEEDEINPAVVFPCQPACQWTNGWNWQLIWTAIFNSRALLLLIFIRILYEFVREGPELAAALKVLALLTCHCTNPAAETGRWHVCGTTQEDREAWGDAWHVCGTDLRHLLQPKFTAHFFSSKELFSYSLLQSLCFVLPWVSKQESYFGWNWYEQATQRT